MFYVLSKWHSLLDDIQSNFVDIWEYIVDFIQLAELIKIRTLPLSHFVEIHTLAENLPNGIHCSKVFRETLEPFVDFFHFAELIELRTFPVSHFFVIHTLAEYQPNGIHCSKVFRETLEPIVDFFHLAELFVISTLVLSHFIEIQHVSQLAFTARMYSEKLCNILWISSNSLNASR